MNGCSFTLKGVEPNNTLRSIKEKGVQRANIQAPGCIK